MTKNRNSTGATGQASQVSPSPEVEHAAPEAAAQPSLGVTATESSPDPVADQLPTAPAKLVKVRILRDCVYGKCDDVGSIDAALVESLAGVVDADPAAVAYAESMAK